MIIVPIEENHEGIGGLTDKKFKAGDYSGSGLEVLGAGLAKVGDSGQQLATALDEKKKRDLAATKLDDDQRALVAATIAAAKLGDNHQGNLDDAAVKNAYVEYSNKAASLLHGDDGLLNQGGAAAHGAFPATIAALADAHDQALAPLDAVQRGVIAPILADRLNGDVDVAATHVQKQGAAEQAMQSLKVQDAAARDAVNHADDPDLFDHHMMTGVKAISQQGKINGQDNKDTERQVADYTSGVHADTIDALMARDPVHAAAWYAKFGGNLNEVDQNRAEAALNPAPAGGQVTAPLEPGRVADESSAPAGPIGGVDIRQSVDGDTVVSDAGTSARQSSDSAPTDPDGENGSGPYANLRSLVDRYPGGGTLKDARFASDKASEPPQAVNAHRALADRWSKMNQQQRLKDPDLAMPAKALDAARVLLLSKENAGLRNAVGPGAMPAGAYVANQVLNVLERKVLPDKISHGDSFPLASDEALQRGGKRSNYLAAEIRDAASYALNYRQQLAWNFFTSGDHPFTHEQAAGLIAALTLENNLDPDKWQNFQKTPASGYGIAQWNTERRQTFAKVMGGPVEGSTFEQQLAYVKYELEEGAYRHFGEQLHQQTDAYQAGYLTTKIYEAPRPRDREQTSVYRGTYALQVLRQFAGR